MSAELTERFEQAFIYAHRLHANQTRKVSGVPYISHLMSVAALVLEDRGSEDEAIAALLHDAIEDQGGQATREQICQQFGDRVAAIVDGCTEWSIPPKPPWKERKLRYLENLQTASSQVRRVSLADKLHNARSLLADWQRSGDEIWNHFGSSEAEILWFYQSLAKVYQETGAGYLTEEFCQVVTAFGQNFSELG